MIILPVSTEVHDGKIRLAGLEIILLCLIVHFFVSRDNLRVEREIRTAITSYYSSDQIWRDTDDSSTVALDPLEKLERYALDEESLEKKATNDVEKIIDRISSTSLIFRFGFVPERFDVLKMLSSLFLHGDWMHLIGNMIFFYVCGVAMEKYWGYWRFLLIYLGCGVASSLAHMGTAMFTWEQSGGIPLVGASGAIAGAMGAFVVTHAKIKVKIFYMIGFWWRGAFYMRSYIYFGLWFLSQLLYALLFLRSRSGVAYGAHVGGFVAGAVLGALVKSEDDAAVLAPVGGTRTTRAVLPEEHTAPPETHLSQAPRTAEQQTADSWNALRNGNHREAAQGFTSVFNNYLLTPENRVQEILDLGRNILTNHRQLAIPAPQMYQWGKTLARIGKNQLAIGYYDATAEVAGENAHLTKNGLLNAAYLRITESWELDRAQAQLRRVIAEDSGGVFAQQARSYLQHLGVSGE